MTAFSFPDSCPYKEGESVEYRRRVDSDWKPAKVKSIPNEFSVTVFDADNRLRICHINNVRKVANVVGI